MMLNGRVVLCVLSLAAAFGCTATAPPAPVPGPPSSAPYALEGISLGRWIRVQKRQRQLVLYDDTQPIRTYPIVLGGNPLGAKLYEGDNRTPEGEYRIAAKYPHAAWSRFMLLDYPTPENRELHAWTVQGGLLPVGRKGAPGVGGQVGIHGTVDDSANRRGEDWTRGCISLLNRDVEELYALVDVGTRVVIER